MHPRCRSLARLRLDLKAISCRECRLVPVSATEEGPPLAFNQSRRLPFRRWSHFGLDSIHPPLPNPGGGHTQKKKAWGVEGDTTRPLTPPYRLKPEVSARKQKERAQRGSHAREALAPPEPHLSDLLPRDSHRQSPEGGTTLRLGLTSNPLDRRSGARRQKDSTHRNPLSKRERPRNIVLSSGGTGRKKTLVNTLSTPYPRPLPPSRVRISSPGRPLQNFRCKIPGKCHLSYLV